MMPKHKGISFKGYYKLLRDSGARNYVLEKLLREYRNYSTEARILERYLASQKDPEKQKELKRIKSIIKFISAESGKIEGAKTRIPQLMANLFERKAEPKTP